MDAKGSATAPEAARIDCDALILGGGLVGLSLGCALAGAGLRVVVVDRADPAATLDAGFDGRVSAIAAGSARILDGVGVWPHAVTEAEPILDIRVTDRDAPVFLHYDHREVGEGPLGYIVENRVMRRALDMRAGVLPTLTRRAPAALVALSRDIDGVEGRLDDGTVVRARLVVGADGRGSQLRQLAGIPVLRRSYRQTAIVCTVAHERPHRGVAQERFLAGGPFAILPMTGNRSSLVWTEPEALAPALMGLDDAAFAAELAWRFTDYLGAVRPVGPRWSYPLSVSWSARIVDDRLALAGDAAHAIHPIAGQGFNLGLRDVAALAESLVDAARLGLDPGAPEALARYARWRRFDTIAMTAVTDGLTRLFATEFAPVALARDLGLAAVQRLPPLKRLFMRHAMGALGDQPRLARGQAL